MPQTRTPKKTALLVLSILKFIGAAFFLLLGIVIIFGGSNPSIQSELTEVLSDDLDTATMNQVIELIGVIGGIIVAMGVGGIVSGALGVTGSKPMRKATGAAVLGILGSLLDVIMFLASMAWLWILMLLLNIVRTVLAFMINSEHNKNMMMGGGMGTPYGGMPQQGGYGQMPGMGMPQQGMPQQGMPQQGSYGPSQGGYGNGGSF